MTHVFRVSTVPQGNRLIDELIASGRFTQRDASALRRMHEDTVRALHKKFAKPVKEDVEMDDEDEVAVMANMGRTGKALERQNQRTAMSARMARRQQPKYFHVARGIHDAEAEAMVPPTHNYRRR